MNQYAVLENTRGVSINKKDNKFVYNGKEFKKGVFVRGEEVKVGELVLSYDEISGEKKSDRVIEIFHHSSIEMPDYYLIINGGLKVTPNHRFYSDGRWVYAGDLKIGDKLFSQDKSNKAQPEIDLSNPVL